MTVETQITALLARANAVLAVPGQLNLELDGLNVGPIVQAQITALLPAQRALVIAALNVPQAVADRYALERPALLASAPATSDVEMVLHVSSAGSNSASGTANAPLATISEAISRVPARGRATIRLMTDVAITAPATIADCIPIDGARRITITSHSDTVLAALSWSTAASATAGNQMVRSFHAREGGLRFHRLRLVSPVAAQTRVGERMPIKVRPANVAFGPSAVPTIAITQSTLEHSAYWGGGHWLWTSPDDVTASLTPLPVTYLMFNNTWAFTGRGANVSIIGLIWAASLEDGFGGTARTATNTHTLNWLITNLPTF